MRTFLVAIVLLTGCSSVKVAAVDPQMDRCVADTECAREVAAWRAKFCTPPDATGHVMCSAPGH